MLNLQSNCCHTWLARKRGFSCLDELPRMSGKHAHPRTLTPVPLSAVNGRH